MNVVSAQFGDGVHEVAKVEIAEAISRAGGSVSRFGLKLALAELSEGTTFFAVVAAVWAHRLFGISLLSLLRL